MKRSRCEDTVCTRGRAAKYDIAPMNIPPDDNNNSEGLQTLGIMNDTDDAFLFYAISEIAASKRPKCISGRNASEPQMIHAPFPDTTKPSQIIDILKGMAGTIYGVYQYCTTLNSAFACWGVIAGL